jgi:glycosyltransferase involved in cell wall biosynthesis
MADLALNPVTSGAGTNIKMLEYMAAGLPIITTVVGSRGLNLTNDEDAIIVSDLEDFRNKVLDVFNSKEVRYGLSQNSRNKVNQFDWAEIESNLRKIFEKTL